MTILRETDDGPLFIIGVKDRMLRYFDAAKRQICYVKYIVFLGNICQRVAVENHCVYSTATCWLL